MGLTRAHDQQRIEQKIIDTVRKAADNPMGPRQVAGKVGKNEAEAKEARELIRSLLTRGVLQLDLDWKLQASVPLQREDDRQTKSNVPKGQKHQKVA